jgi:hypothetical protein
MPNKIPRSWIESRKLPAKFQLYRSFQSPRIQGSHVFFNAILKPPGKILTQKKIPRISFDDFTLCAKFQDHSLTGSTLNRRATRNSPHWLVKKVNWGTRIFFEVRISLAQEFLKLDSKELSCRLKFLSDWKDLESWNLAGSFLHSFQGPRILLVNC